MLKDQIRDILDRDRQLDRIEETTDMKSDQLKYHATLIRAINVLREHEATLQVNMTEEERRVIHRYTTSEDALDTLPKYLTVSEVSELLSITPQMVRRKCTNGDIESHRTLNGKGKWRIPTAQFVDHPEFEELVLRYKKKRNASRLLAAELGDLSSVTEKESENA